MAEDGRSGRRDGVRCPVYGGGPRKQKGAVPLDHLGQPLHRRSGERRGAPKRFHPDDGGRAGAGLSKGSEQQGKEKGRCMKRD